MTIQKILHFKIKKIPYLKIQNKIIITINNHHNPLLLIKYINLIYFNVMSQDKNHKVKVKEMKQI